MFKKILLVFAVAFLLNLAWENTHAILYAHYKNQLITELILARAALFDAVAISILGVMYSLSSFMKNRTTILFALAALFSIGLELWALETGRWAYNDLMPIIPFLNIGLTPAIQLAILSYVTFYIVRKIIK